MSLPSSAVEGGAKVLKHPVHIFYLQMAAILDLARLRALCDLEISQASVHTPFQHNVRVSGRYKSNFFLYIFLYMLCHIHIF